MKIADYGAVQRARMLYNHLYFSALSREVVREYVANSSYWQVVNHKNFSPRIIELVIKRAHRSSDDLALALNHTLDHPLDLWGIIFRNGLSDLAQRITLTLASFPVNGANSEDVKALVQKEAKPTEFTSALRVLEGTFIQVQKQDDGFTMVSYANPSVRDFIFAFLNEEPDYLVSLVSDAIHLAQVSTLLEYAVSEVDRKLKFPNCASAVTRHQIAVKRKVMELVATEEEAIMPESGRRLRIYQRTIKPLLDLLQPALRLMRDSFDEIFAVTTSCLGGPASAYMDSDDWELFNLALVTRHLEDPDQVRDELKWAFDSWGELLYAIDDVTSFEEFFKTHGPMLQQQFDASTKFYESVESGLRQELENLSGNERDRDSDHQWIDQVETAATRIGVWDDLRSDIESARSSIDERYANDEYLHEQPTSGAGYGFPRLSVSAAERVEIEGMFRELS